MSADYFRITVEDLATGERQVWEIAAGDYMLIPTGDCHVSGFVRHNNGTPTRRSNLR